MHKETRKQQILKRGNFLPSLVVTILLSLALTSIVYFTDPKLPFFIFLFFFTLFTFFTFLFSLIFASSRRGLLTSACLTTFAMFRLFGIGTLLNAVLIAGLGIIVEIYEYITKRSN